MALRTNEEWLDALRAGGQRREAALAELREVCLAGLPYALSGWLPREDPAFPALVDDVVQETLLRVLERLDTFEGRSQFTTWVHKIAVRLALTELRRRRWQDVSLEGWLEQAPGSQAARLVADPAPGPEQAAERSALLAYLERLIREELTEKQLRAMTAMITTGMPMDEVARRLGMNRNALYKLLHDGRLRLKRRLAREGLSAGEVMAAFERGSVERT